MSPAADITDAKIRKIAAPLLSDDPVFREVAEAVIFMRLKSVGRIVVNAIQQREPIDVINNGLAAGMAVVANLYSQNLYGLSDIMMSAKTMEIGVAIAEERTGKVASKEPVPVSRDSNPHNISSSMAEAMLKSNGYSLDDNDGSHPVMVDVVAKYMDSQAGVSSNASLMVSGVKPFPNRRTR